jgi:hypothetical protein
MKPILQIAVGTTRRQVISWAAYLDAERASIGGSVTIISAEATATGDLVLGDVDAAGDTVFVWLSTSDMAVNARSTVTVTMETDAGHIEVYCFEVVAREC